MSRGAVKKTSVKRRFRGEILKQRDITAQQIGKRALARVSLPRVNGATSAT